MTRERIRKQSSPRKELKNCFAFDEKRGRWCGDEATWLMKFKWGDLVWYCVEHGAASGGFPNYAKIVKIEKRKGICG